MATKLTRRQAALALSSSAALLAQTPNSAIPQNPDEELKAAHEQLRQNAQQLGQFPLSMDTEPVTVFLA